MGERLTLESLRDALRGRAPEHVRDPVAQRAAVALVLRGGTEGVEVLFIRRAEHPKDPWSGQIAFPGGRSEPGDPDLLATAIRETREETGLDLDAAELLGELDEIRAIGRLRPVDMSIRPFVFHLEGRTETHPSGEVRSVHWLGLDALLRPEAKGTFTYLQQDETLHFPCVKQGEILIWGLTYRMF
ncbi:MAG TPA: CoA pyrophosphatase, partial [Vicinamibacteria bacterium]|nr:CoA pyrophosphatase [Vicinamibacteria bacterium]